MIYGYLRVSSDEQDVNSQKQGVDNFAEQSNNKIDEYITDEGVSGGKDPDKRKLGPLLKKIQNGDIIICSEISRLGRDLYMVMDILHHCMAVGAVIYTVKDKFILGNDIQSKVLAFAFGLSAEIERQMIRQRTKEGLRLRMKMGVLVGRPPGSLTKENLRWSEEQKKQITEQYKWGVPFRRLALNFKLDRNTITRWLHEWGVIESKSVEREKKTAETERVNRYKDGNYQTIELTKELRDRLVKIINLDLIIPRIADTFEEYSYEQIYDTILCDKQLNNLYRKHGQRLIKKQ